MFEEAISKPKKGQFYVMSTMLYSVPDRNRRSIDRWDVEGHRITFNWDMKPWTPEQERLLNEAVAILNKLNDLEPEGE